MNFFLIDASILLLSHNVVIYQDFKVIGSMYRFYVLTGLTMRIIKLIFSFALSVPTVRMKQRDLKRLRFKLMKLECNEIISKAIVNLVLAKRTCV